MMGVYGGKGNGEMKDWKGKKMNGKERF